MNRQSQDHGDCSNQQRHKCVNKHCSSNLTRVSQSALNGETEHILGNSGRCTTHYRRDTRWKPPRHLATQ
jgi:hypothetical protein